MAFNNWTWLFSFLGFVLILAGTSMDSYAVNRQSGVTSFNMQHATQEPSEASTGGFDFGEFWGKSTIRYGTLAAVGSQTHGYSYKTICPVKGQGHYPHHNRSAEVHGRTQTPSKEDAEGSRAFEMNKVNAGMIALLLLSVSTGFVASFTAVLAATNSNVIKDVNTPKLWSTIAFLTTLVTWALWLRGHYEFLRPNNHLEADCRFHTTDSVRSVTDTERYLLADAPYIGVFVGASFALALLSSFFYMLLMVHLGQLSRSNVPSTTQGSKTVAYALLAFTGIFVAASYNSWSHGGFTKYDEYCSKLASNAIQDAADYAGLAERSGPYQTWDKAGIYYRKLSNGNAKCNYQNNFGVFTAFESLSVNVIYADKQNRAALCSTNTEWDEAGDALVQGGRVVLGFAITATILSFLSGFVGVGGYGPTTFWINATALACVVVALLVWGITVDYVISGRCCVECVMGPSIGLLASGAIFLLFSLFYQAWVVAEDVYVRVDESSVPAGTTKFTQVVDENGKIQYQPVV